MNGKETQADLDRCVIWDTIFREGPLDVGDLCEKTGMHHRRVNALVDHEWFVEQHGLRYIATVAGNKRLRHGMLLAG